MDRRRDLKTIKKRLAGQRTFRDLTPSKGLTRPGAPEADPVTSSREAGGYSSGIIVCRLLSDQGATRRLPDEAGAEGQPEFHQYFPSVPYRINGGRRLAASQVGARVISGLGGSTC